MDAITHDWTGTLSDFQTIYNKQSSRFLCAGTVTVYTWGDVNYWDNGTLTVSSRQIGTINVNMKDTRMELENNVFGNSSNLHLNELGLAVSGAFISSAEKMMYNKNTWFSIKQLKTYNQSFNGNGYTWGKNAIAQNVSIGFKIGGWGLGAYNGYTTLIEYYDGKINEEQLC